jgi:hypothetical protein
MRIPPVEELILDIFLCTDFNKPKWDKLAKYFAQIIKIAKDNLIIDWDTGEVGSGKVYVQIRANEHTLVLEAVGNNFANGKLPPDAINSLLELGWVAPEVLDDCPNFSRRFETYELNYEVIGKFVMETFRNGYACTLKQKLSVGPEWVAKKYPFFMNN